MSNPIDCDLAQTCYIQQYVDVDPTDSSSDFNCGPLSYDGHKGTDFALPDRAAIGADIRVFATAGGTVKGSRDGMDDLGYSELTAPAIEGRECGNGVVIEHAKGWETQYCHLRQGSVLVSQGQQVMAGQELGMVGQSGRAEFPHLHLSVRRDGAVVDPFDPDGRINCETPGDSSLWIETPPYRAGGVLDVAFSDAIPGFEAIKEGTAGAATLTPDAPAIVVHGFVFGAQAGDILMLSITGPDGLVIKDDVNLAKTQARLFRAIGKKRRGPWPLGAYIGKAVLVRGPTIISEMTALIHVE